VIRGRLTETLRKWSQQAEVDALEIRRDPLLKKEGRVGETSARGEIASGKSAGY